MQHDAKQSDMAIAPAALRAVVGRIITAVAPHTAEMQAAIAARLGASGNTGRSAAPATSATAHHVSHATGGCACRGGSRAARRARCLVSMRASTMSRDPSDALRDIRTARPNFAQLGQGSATSRIRLA